MVAFKTEIHLSSRWRRNLSNSPPGGCGAPGQGPTPQFLDIYLYGFVEHAYPAVNLGLCLTWLSDGDRVSAITSG